MDAPETRIRRLVPADAELYRAIRLESLRLSPEAYGSAVESEELEPLQFFAGRLASSHVLGAFRGTEIVGIAGFVVQAGVKSAHKGFLWGVYVQPAARKAGLARRLCEAVLALAEGQVEVLQLTVTSTNRHARRLYQSLGFVEYGLEKSARKVDGVFYDDVLMAKALGKPAK